MATQPHPTPQPKPTPPPTTPPRPPQQPPGAHPPDPQDEKLRLANVEGAAAEPPVRTIADEQRERSDEIAAMGTAAWVEAHDEREPDAKPKAVAGVQHRPVEAHEARR